MSKFVITGGKNLNGGIRVSGSKNAVLPLIAASVLVPETKLANVPRIRDVDVMLEIIAELGGSFEWTGEHDLAINTSNLASRPLSDSARKLRASVLFAGPLLARFGKASLPYPGGDIIGSRPLESHISAFKSLGVEAADKESINFEVKNKEGGTIILEEPSVTATENLIIFAAGGKEEVVIRLAATEPHVQDLCKFLVKAGAQIDGIGTTTLKVKGGNLKNVEHSVLPDELEISAFAALAAATHGDVVISPIEAEYLDSVLLQLQKMNVNFKVEAAASGETSLHILPPLGSYKAHRLQSGLYPKLVTDHLPPLAVLATQAEGATLVHDWLYEARQSYIRELIKMGANSIIMDPHRALILGPTPLYGKEVTTFDIRSGMAMIIAALIAEGETVISDIKHIDRGYENLEGRLKALGADIRRLE